MNEPFPAPLPTLPVGSEKSFRIVVDSRLTDEDYEVTKRAALLLVETLTDASRRGKHGQFGVRVGRNRSKLGMIKILSEVES